jgi:plasmid stabilization system protein ParE
VDYRLLFTQRALTDLADIVGRIAEDDREAAARFGSALLDHVDLLRRFPRMGNLIEERSRVRKLIHTPILIYHTVQDDTKTIEVLHMRHGARQAPEL